MTRAGIRASILSGCALTAIGTNVPPATAQAAGQPPASNGSPAAGEAKAGDSGQLQDIVVTAQRRSEKMQSVPVSVQVATSETLITHNITGLLSIATIAPSVQASVGSGRGANLYIRGIGTGRNQSFDQAVGTFVDDIYHGRSRTSSSTFLDLDRIEILKGPQSTFFGNNAIAGAFNIATKKPTDHWEGFTRALISPGGDSGRQFAIESAVGGPINDVFDFRAAATFNGQEGWLTNVSDGKRAPRDRNVAGRLTLGFKPSSSFDATLKLEAGHNKSDGALAAQIVNCPPPAPYVAAGFCATIQSLGLPVGLNNNKYSATGGAGTDLATKEAVLTANYHAGSAEITSVTGYYEYDFDFKVDADGTPMKLLGADLPEHYNQFSQEIRLTSAPGGKIDYMLGGYFQKDYLYTDTQFNYGFLSPIIQSAPAFAALVPYLPLGLSTLGRQHERLLSIFGSATWNVNSHIKLSAGLRASWVKKDFDWRLQFGTATDAFGTITPTPATLDATANKLGIGTAGALGFSREDHALMPSAKLQYEFSPRVMTYFSYTRGFLAGGFNVADSTAIASNFPFEPEYVDAYEFGLKGEWFNKHLLTNISVFRSDYSKLQASINSVNAAGAYVSVVRNAAAARSQGVELEAQAVLAKWFRLLGAVTYLDSKYLSYPGAGPTTAQQAAGIKTQDLSGHRTPFAPQWSGSVTGTLKAPLAGDYRFTTELTSIFRTTFDTGIIDDPVNRNPGYLRLDGRIAIETPDRRWTLELIGKNLTNQTIITYSDPFARSLGTQAQQKEQPRNVALQVRYAW